MKEDVGLLQTDYGVDAGVSHMGRGVKQRTRRLKIE
jgi:hypothetical protein